MEGEVDSGFAYSPDSSPQFESDTPLLGPPYVIAALAAAQVLLQAIFLIPATTLWHVIGYVIGLLGVPLTVFEYRRVDRRRQRSDLYVTLRSARLLVPLTLVGSLAFTVLHAYYLALIRTLA
jgi:hypothetical protein